MERGCVVSIDIGHTEDRAWCQDCDFAATGAWSSDEGKEHRDATGHELKWLVRVSSPAPSDIATPVCHTCRMVEYLFKWADWDRAGRELWGDWPDDRDDDPPGSDAHLEARPEAPAGWLGAVGDYDYDSDHLWIVLPLLTCAKHPGTIA
jgi:hypothetical protein